MELCFRTTDTLIDVCKNTAKVYSMAQTTSYTCTAIPIGFSERTSLSPSIYAPEEIAVQPKCFGQLLSYLEGHHYSHSA